MNERIKHEILNFLKRNKAEESITSNEIAEKINSVSSKNIEKILDLLEDEDEITGIYSTSKNNKKVYKITQIGIKNLNTKKNIKSDNNESSLIDKKSLFTNTLAKFLGGLLLAVVIAFFVNPCSKSEKTKNTYIPNIQLKVINNTNLPQEINKIGYYEVWYPEAYSNEGKFEIISNESSQSIKILPNQSLNLEAEFLNKEALEIPYNRGDLDIYYKIIFTDSSESNFKRTGPFLFREKSKGYIQFEL